jgi:hypothetical protein
MTAGLSRCEILRSIWLATAPASDAPLRRAQDLRRRGEVDSGARGETSFALARALWEAGGNRAAARDAAETARSEYAKVAGTESTLRAIDAWLAAHAGRATAGAQRGP